VTKLEYLHNPAVFQHAIVHHDRSVNQLAQGRPTVDAGAHSRVALEKVYVIKQSLAESRRGDAVRLSNLSENRLEIG
jgi:hypothetical protein